jgi:hypothetical protein
MGGAVNTAEAVTYLRELATSERRRFVEPGTTPYIEALELAVTALEDRGKANTQMVGHILDELWELAKLSESLSPAPWSPYEEQPCMLRDARGRSVAGFALVEDADGIANLRNRLASVLAKWVDGSTPEVTDS